MNRAILFGIYFVLSLFGLIQLIYGGFGIANYGITGVIPELGIPFLLPLVVGAVCVGLSTGLLLNELRTTTHQSGT